MGLEMLGGKRTRAQQDPGSGADKDDPNLVPFAMLMIAGPGAITTVVTFTARGSGWQGHAIVLGAVTLLTVTLVLSLWASVWLSTPISTHGHGVLLRFMGLILVSVGAQFLLSGNHTFL